MIDITIEQGFGTAKQDRSIIAQRLISAIQLCR
jgi:hypothetical protein